MLGPNSHVFCQRILVLAVFHNVFMKNERRGRQMHDSGTRPEQPPGPEEKEKIMLFPTASVYDHAFYMQIVNAAHEDV